MSKYRNPLTGTIERHPRHSCLEGLDHTGGRIDNFTLYWPSELTFPFIVPCEGKVVFGEFYYDVDSSTLDELDIIEEVPSGLFERTIVTVHTRDGIENGFVYIGGQKLRERFAEALSYEDLTVHEN